MNWLTSTLNFLSAPVTQWVKNRGEVNAAEHTRDLAIISNQARLAQSEETHNHEWEMQSLKGNSRWLRLVCFLQFALPITITCLSPETGKEVFTNLGFVPPWFVQTYMIIVGSIWGIHEFKQAAPAVISAVLRR